MSKSHARIAFENFFYHFDGDYHFLHWSLAAVTSITLENENRFSKNVFQQPYGHVLIFHSMAFVLVL